jgi:hypothetical protein
MKRTNFLPQLKGYFAFALALCSFTMVSQNDKITLQQKNVTVDHDPTSTYFIQGQVFQKQGKSETPLTATVKIKGTDIYANADKTGYYQLTHHSDGKTTSPVILIAECKGFVTKEITVADASKRNNTLNIELKPTKSKARK